MASLEVRVMLSIYEVADLLKVSDKTIRRLVRANKIKAMKVGHSWRINRADLQIYLDKHSNKPNA
jgi:excisionase family DNA binding protein